MNQLQKSYFINLLLVLTFIYGSSVSCLSQDNLDFQTLLKPVDSSKIFINDNYYTWGSTVIKGEDGKYHMFYSRWPHGIRKLDDDTLNYIFDGFKGWNKYSEIAYAVSDNLTGPYRHVATILKGTGDTNRWDRFTYHNPHIRFFDGYYYLYFISNSFDPNFKLDKPTSKENLQWLKYNCTQKIGVIKAKTIDDFIKGNFSYPEKSIMEPDNKRTFEVATNPTVTRGPNGKYFMMYKSRLPNVGHMTFWIATADKPDGPFTTVSAALSSAEMACEDPSIWYDNKRKRFYAVAKYFSNAKKLAPQFGALVLITSESGLDWKPANHSLVSLKELKFSNGNREELAHLERPFVVVDKNGRPLALFAAASVKNPFQGNVMNITNETNTFNVHISLK